MATSKVSVIVSGGWGDVAGAAGAAGGVAGVTWH